MLLRAVCVHLAPVGAAYALLAHAGKVGELLAVSVAAAALSLAKLLHADLVLSAFLIVSVQWFWFFNLKKNQRRSHDSSND